MQPCRRFTPDSPPCTRPVREQTRPPGTNGTALGRVHMPQANPQSGVPGTVCKLPRTVHHTGHSPRPLPRVHKPRAPGALLTAGCRLPPSVSCSPSSPREWLLLLPPMGPVLHSPHPTPPSPPATRPAHRPPPTGRLPVHLPLTSAQTGCTLVWLFLHSLQSHRCLGQRSPPRETHLDPTCHDCHL